MCHKAHIAHDQTARNKSGLGVHFHTGYIHTHTHTLIIATSWIVARVCCSFCLIHGCPERESLTAWPSQVFPPPPLFKFVRHQSAFFRCAVCPTNRLLRASASAMRDSCEVHCPVQLPDVFTEQFPRGTKYRSVSAWKLVSYVS